MKEPPRSVSVTEKGTVDFSITELIGATYLIQNAQLFANCLRTDVALFVQSLCISPMYKAPFRTKVKPNDVWEKCEVESSMCGGEKCTEKASVNK